MRVLRNGLLVMAAALFSAALAAPGDAGPTQAKSGDGVVNVSVPVLSGIAQALPINQLGQVAYKAQENTLGATTGSVGMSHYYVWVGANNQYVPVDPIRVK